MSDEPKKYQRRDVARSYRLDPETIELIVRLRDAMRDPVTGQSRTATDVIRAGVRVLAKRHLSTQ